MIFYNDKRPNSTVVSKGRRIAHFKDGKFETDNKRLIERLKPHYRFESNVMSGLAKFLKLKKEAIEKGVYKKGMKKKDIEEALGLEMQGKTTSEGNKNPQDESLKKIKQI